VHRLPVVVIDDRVPAVDHAEIGIEEIPRGKLAMMPVCVKGIA